MSLVDVITTVPSTGREVTVRKAIERREAIELLTNLKAAGTSLEHFDLVDTESGRLVSWVIA